MSAKKLKFFVGKMLICLGCSETQEYAKKFSETSCLNKSLALKWFYGYDKSYRIWFLPTSGISSCGISQGEIISVNWLLCYRFFIVLCVKIPQKSPRIPSKLQQGAIIKISTRENGDPRKDQTLIFWSFHWSPFPLVDIEWI